MNKFTSVSFCFISFLIIPIMQLKGEARTIRVGVFQAAPMVMMKPDKPEGLFIDLIEYFSAELGWKVEYVPGVWNEQLENLKKGEIDLLPAVGYSKEREIIYDFSKNPVYIDSGVLFTNPDFTIHTVFDLRGKKVAALKGSIFTTGFINYIRSFGVNCEIIFTNDNQAVMEMISAGKTDAGVCIYSLGNELAQHYPVKITPISFSPIALEFAVARGMNADLINDIDRLMADMIKDPNSLYSKSFQKWTARQSSDKIPDWLLWGSSGLLLIGLFFGLWSFLLKRQVALKTRNLEKEISEHKLAEEKTSQSLREKETLLRELYHRTKNTLQVIRGMVVLQADEFPENINIQQLVKNTDERIQAIALVHQMLYQSNDLSRISIKNYIQELSVLIFQSFGISEDRISLKTDIEDQFILLDVAIPLGLILNELMSNSLKHAFPDGRKGLITIIINRSDTDRNILKYYDNGIGVPEGFNFRNQNTLGLKLIHSIGEMQLLGKVTFANTNGISCFFEIPEAQYKARI